MSQIATTIEQSKRLLAAGLDPASADMCYIEEIITNGIGCIPYKRTWSEYPCVNTREEYEGPEPVSLPAWSLSRLWDIMRGLLIIPWPKSSAELITLLVAEISNRANDGTLSKELLK